jgi:transcriptional regulator with XRE-family HTH domain
VLLVLISYANSNMPRPATEDRYLRAFGKRLATVRESRAMSQERLAVLAGVSRETIGLLERGQRWARLSTLHRIAKCLDVPTKELFEGLRQ